MSISADVKSGVLYIKVSGRFDFGVHNEFREASKLAESGVNLIEIDLANADYLDSSALGMLLVLRDRMTGDKNAVHIKNAKNEVKKIIEIANFDKLFTIL
ncbi:STAS domain-containing protein [Methylomonas sp. AM2-LC]|uniref:STAS domain-containing protein n=1 Tax=Methylomonas sp. AM2-LC TaxID=3153301 RepID=UPI003263B461